MACGSLKLSPGTWFQVGCPYGIWVLGAGEVPNCGALDLSRQEGPFLQRLDWLVWTRSSLIKEPKGIKMDKPWAFQDNFQNALDIRL